MLTECRNENTIQPMETRQINKVEMYAEVVATCLLPEHADAVREIPGFDDDATSFQDLQPQIRDLMETSLLLDSSGATLGKDALRNRLAEAAAKVSAALVNVAERLGDTVLAQQAYVTKSQLLAGRGTEASIRVDRLIELASAQLESRKDELARYRLTEDRLDALERHNQQFATSIGHPRRVIRERKIANQTLPDLLRQADAILTRMDRMSSTLEETHPDFVRAYLASRQIIRTAATRDTAPTREEAPTAAAAELDA